jgi:hypothetical protein
MLTITRRPGITSPDRSRSDHAVSPAFSRRSGLGDASIKLLLAVGFLLSVCLFAGPELANASESFGIASFSTSVSSSQAGGHPDFTTSFAFDTNAEGDAVAQPKNVRLDLPPGLLGDPQATPQCTPEALSGYDCQPSQQVGVLDARFTFPGQEPVEEQVPVYNMLASSGHTATLAVTLAFVPVLIQLDLRRDGSYGLSATIEDLSTLIPLQAVSLTLWGVPADQSHDAQREGPPPEHSTPTPAGVPPAPFILASSDCSDGPLESSLSVQSWQGQSASASAAMPAPTGCGLLAQSSPGLTVSSETTQAASPSGYTVDLSTPQDLQPDALGTPDLRSVVVTLPAGTVLDPSAANGLVACSQAAFSLRTGAAVSCPAASSIGSVQISTPLLSGPLSGSLYLAEEDNNPFGSLIALYLLAEGGGVQIKLAGRVELTPVSGQLTASFAGLPQLPFTQLELSFTGGAGALLSNPRSCGPAQSTAALTAYSDPTPIEASSSFAVSGCGTAFAPAFIAGISNPRAGAYTPFSAVLSRQDSEPTLGALSVALPPGLGAMLAGVAQCPAPEAAAGECGAGSLLGQATVAIGAGPDPYWIHGRVYLTGPYGGGPFGLAIVLPALAGPFDLGQVVVRAAIDVDPATSALSIRAGSLPQILDGIPLQLRTIALVVDRPAFLFAPTDCAARAVTASVSSPEGPSASVSSPFDLGGCRELSFKPSLSAWTQGSDRFAGDGASLRIKIAARAQGPQNKAPEATIRSVHVELPLLLPTRLTTLQKACPAPQFAADPTACPASSRVGGAAIRTPILPVVLQGPAYLVSYGGAAFPDLVLLLRGDGVTIELTGKTQIRAGVIYTHFDQLPDSPLLSFELNLPEGPHSALAATANLCQRTKLVTVQKRVTVHSRGRIRHLTRRVKQRVLAPLRMPVRIEAHNGAVLTQTTKVAVTGCPKPKHASARAPKKPAKQRVSSQ